MKLTFRPIEKWPREEEKYRSASPFFSTYDKTLKLLGRELDAIDADHPVLQLDIRESDVRIDGTLKAVRLPSSPRVILSFETKKLGAVQMPCDKFTNWKDNLRAIALALEALRKVDRYGVTSSGEQYTGWKALPPATGLSTVDEAARFISSQTLIFSPDSATPESGILRDVDVFWSAYRVAAKRLHPDFGGDRDQWEQLARAREILERHFEGPQ